MAEAMKSDIILAIDPGTRAVGLAVFIDGELRDTELLKASQRNTQDRMVGLVNAIFEYARQLATKDRQVALVFEDPQYFGSGVRPIVALYQFVGALVTVARLQVGVSTVTGYAEASIKNGVAGRPNATKAEVQAILRHEYNRHDDIISEDEWDAVAVGTYHLAVRRRERNDKTSNPSASY
tara:strand:- start:841 stop:1380 length:540 start_codon:yes stop_codon:yes gene_type:complete